jgi:hypothetical protein
MVTGIPADTCGFSLPLLRPAGNNQRQKVSVEDKETIRCMKMGVNRSDTA